MPVERMASPGLPLWPGAYNSVNAPADSREGYHRAGHGLRCHHRSVRLVVRSGGKPRSLADRTATAPLGFSGSPRAALALGRSCPSGAARVRLAGSRVGGVIAGACGIRGCSLSGSRAGGRRGAARRCTGLVGGWASAWRLDHQPATGPHTLLESGENCASQTAGAEAGVVVGAGTGQATGGRALPQRG